MARFDTPEFISELNLDPNTWHVVGEPAPKQTDPKEPAPSAASLITPGKDSQGKTVPAPGRDSVEWTVTVVGPSGQSRQVTVRPSGAGLNAANVGLNQLDWNVTGVDETVKPPTAGQTPAEQNARVAEAEAQAQTAKSNAEIAAANLKKVEEDTREREYNQAHGDGYLTHDEVRKNKQDGVANNLTQQQIDARRDEISNNNKNAARSNEIAALNADTAAANAATTAQATLSRTKYEEGQLGLDQAKFDHQKAQDEITQRNVESKQKLDELQQQQANEIAQQTLEQRRVEGKETAASNAATLEQRKAEQAAAAQQAQATLQAGQQNTAVQAATGVYGTERQAQTQAGTVGGNLLSNRATAANNLLNNILSGASGLSQGSAGRYGMLGGGLHAMPAGFDATQMLQGIQGVTAGQFGGQDTLDAAAAMVRGAAPGAELTPQGQAAIAVIQQAFEKQHQLSGQPAPQVAAAAAARQTTANGGLAAPVTTVPAPVQAMSAVPVNAVPGQNYGATQAYTGGVSPWNAQPGPAFQAPTTIMLNV